MSDLLTHWAVFDDARRLAAHDTQCDSQLLQLLDNCNSFARLGAITRYGSQFVPRILNDALARKSEVANDERLQNKIAFALGGILHFPADHVFKPLMSELAQADWEDAHHAMQNRGEASEKTKVSVREISAYYDCHVFRKVYLAGNEEPFSRFFVTENSTEPGQALEAFVRSLFQRALLSSHTLAPDMQNFDAWLDNLINRVQPLYIDIAMYVRVFQNPDPQKMETYQVESSFYSDDDALIQLARRVQRGNIFSQDEMETALNTPNRSGYSECLRMSVNLLREASAFWNGQRDTPPDVTQDTSWRRK
jgi:hypothetical protein